MNRVVVCLAIGAAVAASLGFHTPNNLAAARRVGSPVNPARLSHPGANESILRESEEPEVT